MVALEEEGKEATAQQLQTIIDLAKAENIKVIFYQEEIDRINKKTDLIDDFVSPKTENAGMKRYNFDVRA